MARLESTGAPSKGGLRPVVPFALALAFAGSTLEGSIGRDFALESTVEYSGRGWHSVRELNFVHSIGPEQFRVRALYFCGARKYIFPGQVNSSTDNETFNYSIPIAPSELEATESTFVDVDELYFDFRAKVLKAATQACSVQPRLSLTEDLKGVFLSRVDYFSIKNSRFRSEGNSREFWIDAHNHREARRKRASDTSDQFTDENSTPVFFIYSFASSVEKWSVNCEDWTIRVLAYVEYDRKGTLIRSAEAGSKAISSSIVPDSAGDSLAKTACMIR